MKRTILIFEMYAKVNNSFLKAKNKLIRTTCSAQELIKHEIFGLLVHNQ